MPILFLLKRQTSVMIVNFGSEMGHYPLNAFISKAFRDFKIASNPFLCAKFLVFLHHDFFYILQNVKRRFFACVFTFVLTFFNITFFHVFFYNFLRTFPNFLRTQFRFFLPLHHLGLANVMRHPILPFVQII